MLTLSDELRLLFKEFKTEIIKELHEIRTFLNIKPKDPSLLVLEPLITEESQQIISVNDYIEDTNRNEEISLYNQSISGGNLYYYYWKIENIDSVLQKRNIYIHSSKFQVLGK